MPESAPITHYATVKQRRKAKQTLVEKLMDMAQKPKKHIDRTGQRVSIPGKAAADRDMKKKRSYDWMKLPK